jgi:N-formylglutamate deformylase
MPFRPFTLLEPTAPRGPLVVDSPHSGREYPDDFKYSCSLSELRQTEDFLVDELVAGAAQAGATIIAAQFPRCYIDVNRAECEIDPAMLAEAWPAPLSPDARTLKGLGLVPHTCLGAPIYNAKLPVAEVQKRIENFYRPYHQALQEAVKDCKNNFDECYLVDCHSMLHRSELDGTNIRADFVLGDRNGTSCDPSFTRRVQVCLQDMGYSVVLNDPYKGAEIVRRYGHPQMGQHALQIEINRRLYMNEATLEKNHGFARLQQNLSAFFQSLGGDLMRNMPDRLAAE